jgi:hypothetical protein
MSDDQKKQLEQHLWNIANTLRGKMNADEFRDYILGFIFYKYLAEKMEIFPIPITTFSLNVAEIVEEVDTLIALSTGERLVSEGGVLSGFNQLNAIPFALLEPP